MPKKRSKRLNKNQYRINQKTIYRYHDGAKPGDEFYAKPRGDRSQLYVERSPFPGPGDVRFHLDPNGKRLYRLHGGAPSPIKSEKGKNIYGFTSEEMDDFLARRQRWLTQSRNIFQADQERRQRAFQKEQEARERAKEEDPQQTVSGVLDFMVDRGFIPGGIGKPAAILANQMENDKSVLSRVMDIASRPLYSVGNTIQERILRDKQDDDFGSVKSFLKGIQDFGTAFTPAGAVQVMQGDEDALDTRRAMVEGFTGRKKVTPSTIFQEHYGASGVGGFAAGLGGDIALDPLTYTPAGLIKAPFQIAQRALRGSKPVVQAANENTRVLRNAPVMPNSLDELVDTRLPTSERIARVDKLNEAIVQPTVRRYFDQEAERGLQDLVRQGKLNSDEATRLLEVRESGPVDLNRVISDVTSSVNRKATHLNVEDLSGAQRALPSTPGRPEPTPALPGAVQGALPEARSAVSGLVS